MTCPEKNSGLYFISCRDYKWYPVEMIEKSEMTQPSPKKGNFKVSRQEWLDAARATLIKEGIAAVRVERLAKKLGVTRGGFYWFFKSRQELLDSLLEDWSVANTQPFINAVEAAGPNPKAQFNAITDLYLEEEAFSPAYDAALRDWARTSKRVLRAVEEADETRIALLTRVLKAMGYEAEEAFIRARVTYFHQVGYYAMGIREDRETREHYLPIYQRILMGEL